MKWRVFTGSAVFFLFSCASVKEIEMHSRQNIASIENLIRPTEVRELAKIEVKEKGLRPLLKGSKWIRVWRGSYWNGRAVVPSGWIYLKLEDEEPLTNF